MNEVKEVYYDDGWNAFLDGKPFNYEATLDWKDGWLDCSFASRTEKQEKI